MTTRIPISVPGALAPWVDVDLPVAYLASAGAVVRTFLAVTDAPSGGNEVIDIRNATGDGGSGVTVTITDGNRYATITDQLALGATETVYCRIETDSGAMNLSGWLEFEPTGTSEVTTFLTTLARVKTDHGIGVSTWDAQLNRLIEGVSKAMQRWMKRDIVDTTYTEEVHSGNGLSDAIVLHNRPITATTTMVVLESDSTVSAANYTTDDEAGIVYTKTGYWASGVWSSGRRNLKVTYSAGYTSVPEDLAMAATDEVRHRFNQSSPSAKDRLGLVSNADAAGGSTAYVPGSFLPSTLEIMRQYRRLA